KFYADEDVCFLVEIFIEQLLLNLLPDFVKGKAQNVDIAQYGNPDVSVIIYGISIEVKAFIGLCRLERGAHGTKNIHQLLVDGLDADADDVVCLQPIWLGSHSVYGLYRRIALFFLKISQVF